MKRLSAVQLLAFLAAFGVCANAQDNAPPTTKKLDTVVVEPDADFGDFEPWRQNIEAGLAKGKLKSRSALTAHDLKQILILQDDVPRLRAAMADMAQVISNNPRPAMLTEDEKLALTRAYVKAQAVLQNIPDALALQCKLVSRSEKRNKVAMCAFDYARAQEFLRHLAGKRPRRESTDPKRRFAERVGIQKPE